MRCLVISLTVLLGGNLVLAQAPTPATDELKKLSGQYKPLSVLFDGIEQVAQDSKTRNALTLVIDKGEYRAYFQLDPKKDSHFRLFTADMTVDPAAKSFELVIKDGQRKGERRHGIYELVGSQLRVCYGPAEKPRPTSFSAPKGSEFFCEMWTLEKR